MFRETSKEFSDSQKIIVNYTIKSLKDVFENTTLCVYCVNSRGSFNFGNHEDVFAKIIDVKDNKVIIKFSKNKNNINNNFDLKTIFNIPMNNRYNNSEDEMIIEEGQKVIFGKPTNGNIYANEITRTISIEKIVYGEMLDR